jgi:hypothetical protein
MFGEALFKKGVFQCKYGTFSRHFIAQRIRLLSSLFSSAATAVTKPFPKSMVAIISSLSL